MKKTKKITNKEKDRFAVKRAARGKGKGLYAKSLIKRGEFILEYVGKKIPTSVADELTTRYLFEIDKNWTIDGSHGGNVSRYINHSCDPNCECEIDKGHIMIYAIKKIEPGQELSYDYGKEYFEEFIRPVGCLCGSPKCKQPAKK